MNSTENTDGYASSPCMAHEQNAGYAGYFINEEIIECLQPLLEAERAGARISKESGEALSVEKLSIEALSEFLNHLKADETKYCKMLISQIKRLGGHPGDKTGDFYEKCMAINDLAERLTYLNRGQNWVVKKLDELLPRLNDAQLIAVLREMRDTHIVNMQLADVQVKTLK